MSVEIVQFLPKEQWRTFVEQHPKGNIFHTPEMFKVYEATKEYRPELWAAIDGERVLALMIPIHISLMGGLLKYLTTRSVVFGGVLCQENFEGRHALADLLRHYKHSVGNSSLFTEVRNISSLAEIGPILLEADFMYEEHLNYLIDLDRNPKDIFAAIGARTRKNIRRGLNKGGVIIEEVTDREKIGISYDLISHTYSKAGVPLADRSLFEAAFEILYPRGMVKFFLVYVGEIPVATSVELFFKDVIYGWYSGLNREYGAFVPNELLMWHILQEGAGRGFHVYDFGGAGKPDEKYGVRDFKAKFGGRLVCFGRNLWVRSPLLFEISKINYQIYRKFQHYVTNHPGLSRFYSSYEKEGLDKFPNQRK